MKISVVIVGFRNPGDVERCLAALSHSSYKEFDVFVCENGGEEAYDALDSLPRQLKGGQMVEFYKASTNLGFAGGVNVGIHARPSADAWWILNPDTIPSPACLEGLVKRLAQGSCSAVGGVLADSDGRVQSLGGKWNMFFARATRARVNLDEDERSSLFELEKSIDFISGANMLVSRSLVASVGVMREDYFLYAEEVEWCLRAKSAGHNFGFAPTGRVIHHQGSTTGAGKNLSDRPKLPVYLDERNRLHIVRDLRPLWLPISIFASFAALTFRFAARGHFLQWRYAVAGWLAGVRNERGSPSWLDS